MLRNIARISPLASRHAYLYLCEFYKLYKNISPKLFNDMMIVKNELIYNSRAAAAHCNIKIQRMNKRVGQRSVNYLGPITFNSLPTNIKTSPSFAIFKKRLREKMRLLKKKKKNVLLLYKLYIVLHWYKNKIFTICKI